MKYRLLIKQPVRDLQVFGTSMEDLAALARRILPTLPPAQGADVPVAQIYATQEVLVTEFTIEQVVGGVGGAE